MEPLPSRSDLPSLVGPHHIAELVEAARDAPPGCFVEVGVYKGGTAWHLYGVAEAQGRDLWLYDTFEGIPYADEGDSHKAGDFGDADVKKIRTAMPKAHIRQGIFPESADMRMDGIAFVHLDVDQGKAYRHAIGFLRPRMVRGGIMWFDDSPVIPAAKRAVEELFGPELRLSEGGKHYVVL